MKKFTIITALYITLLIISNLMATKLVSIFGLTLPAAVIAYPLCFMTGDVLTEVWGFKEARKVILLGFGLSFLLTAWTNLGIYMPHPSFWKGQEAYATIFGAVPRITIASFAGYIAGELTNSATLEWIKKKTGSKWLFVRTIGSTVAGQVFDTILFFGIAYYGTVSFGVLLGMMVAQYVFKVLCEALAGTPLAYGLIKWARKEYPDAKPVVTM